MNKLAYRHYTGGHRSIDEDELMEIEHFHTMLLNTVNHFKFDNEGKEVTPERFRLWLDKICNE